MNNVQSNSWVEVSSSALLKNIKTVKIRLRKGTKFFAVVKANAYGHGLGLVTKTVEPFVDGFCVASTQEALELRKKFRIKKRILVVSYFTTLETNHIKLISKNNIEVPLISTEQSKRILKTNIPLTVHIKIDTGTSRIGVFPKEVANLLQSIKRSRNITVKGIYSHFAEAEKEKDGFTKVQLTLFRSVANQAEKILRRKLEKHIACSAAALTLPESHFDVVRVGIHLYGLSGLGVNKGLEPVLAWKTRILQLKTVQKGTTVGYNRTYKVQKKSVIGIIPVGYWDGYDRRLSNRGNVIVKNIQCPVRGIVCMNLTMFDASKMTNPRAGDVVTLISNTGKASTDSIARTCKTINYEIVTRINPQIPRVLV